MKNHALKQSAAVLDDVTNSLSALDRQELNLQALDIMAEWREDLTTRLRRVGLKFELIGTDEHEEIAREAEEFQRCCRVLGWRP